MGDKLDFPGEVFANPPSGASGMSSVKKSSFMWPIFTNIPTTNSFLMVIIALNMLLRYGYITG